MSPRKDTRCALRELTRESRVPAMKHGISANAREKDGWAKERQINRKGERNGVREGERERGEGGKGNGGKKRI